MAPNFCAHCGAKVIPEQKFCQDCGVLLATTSTDTVTNGSVPLSATPSSTTQSRAQINARVLGIIGGVIGALIGAIFFEACLIIIGEYYTGYFYYFDTGAFLLRLLLVLGILGFSIVGALGAAQKLDARPTVDAGALFLAGVVILLCICYITITGPATSFSAALIFILAGIVISVLFFLSGFLLVRKPAS